MRKLIEFKIVEDGDKEVDASKVRNLIARIRAMRRPTADYVSMAKKQGIKGGGYLIEAVHTYRQAMKEALSPKRYYEVIRRFGRNEIVSEYMPVVHTTNDLKHIVSELKQKVRSTRQRRANNDIDYLAQKRPNMVLFQLHEKALSETKKPTTADRYIGIEIECVMPENADLTLLFPFAKWVNIGTDGSIRTDRGQIGRELRVCIKKDELREVITPLMAALTKLGAKVNKSCGLHVHLDQRNSLNPGESFDKLVRSLGLLYLVVPKSRRENSFCKKNRRLDFSDAVHSERYKAINAAAYRRYKTLEVRLFGGTLNAGKIINWIEVLHAIADGKATKRCPKNFDLAAKYWSLTAENLAWLKARQEQFAAINPLSPTSESDTELEEAVSIDEFTNEELVAELAA